MTERRVHRESKRAIDLIMTKEDDVALTHLLRENFSPLEIIAVDFRRLELRVLETLGESRETHYLYIVNPDQGEPWLERLQTALLFCSNSIRGLAPFEASLPRCQTLYHRTEATFPTRSGHELMRKGVIHFVYDRDDAEAHRFTNKMFRLLSKFLVNRFAVVDAETGQFVRESDPVYMLKVGPNALERCRRHPNLYLDIEWSRPGEGENLFLKPLSPERYEELKAGRRKRRPTPPPQAPAAPTG